MAKTRPNSNQPAGQGGAPISPWSAWVRVLVSFWVVWHLFALFISPLSVPPTSELVARVAQSPLLRWYSDPLYMNHGYHFFGPDPPIAGQLVRYKVTGEDGSTVAEGEFPNLDQQWPRLFYHRHMMLADQASGTGIAPTPRENAELMLRGYARHLLRKHDGTEVRLEHLEHLSLHPADVREGADPSEPRFYPVLQTVTERKADLETPLLIPAVGEPLPNPDLFNPLSANPLGMGGQGR